ncbi:hypothetical protein ACLOAV_004927 [Pseudogymnoascus australis]
MHFSLASIAPAAILLMASTAQACVNFGSVTSYDNGQMDGGITDNGAHTCTINTVPGFSGGTAEENAFWPVNCITGYSATVRNKGTEVAYCNPTGGLAIRYKISAPAELFTTASGVPGGAATAATAGQNGLNVLLHGDGGQSFVDFPNQAVQGGLMGVVVLAPDENLFWGGGSGLDRTDGVEHSAAVNTLIQEQLPQDVAFDPANVFFTGVSGGALMLSGFFMPAFGAAYKTGVMLNCGALAPQVAVVDAATLAASTRIHFQSTQNELALLQPAIPEAVAAYESLAADAGLSAAEVGALQTVDASPAGGHCEFDEQGFVSGVQLMADSFADVMLAGGSGQVGGIGNVLTTVVGNEDINFGAPS